MQPVHVATMYTKLYRLWYFIANYKILCMVSCIFANPLQRIPWIWLIFLDLQYQDFPGYFFEMYNIEDRLANLYCDQKWVNQLIKL